ncbi:MAG: glycosyltransferase [Microthrixaceae bacterium]|nr:glycosyltransferase [Microthrixaceae bacterium]
MCQATPAEPMVPRMRRLARSAAGAVVRSTVGTLPLFEYKLEVTRWRAAREMQRREDRLVQEHLRTKGATPSARVTTVVATYRRPEMLALAVASAIEQTVTDQRIVVVDDGGGELGDLPDDPRITVVELAENVGTAGVVRNVGIRLSHSPLVAFLDDDNTWTPDHLEVALEAHARGAGFTYSSLERVDGSGVRLDTYGEPFDRSLMKERSLVDTNAMVLERTPRVLFSRVPRGRDDFPGEDWELTWRLSRHMKVVHIPRATVRYVVHSGSNYSHWGTAAES